MDKGWIGSRGESMFETLILAPWDRPEPLFNPAYFGDKFPTLDHYVELVGATARYYFFVQVKSTALGYEEVHEEKRLRVRVSKTDVDRLVAFPAPTYIVGIDERKWKAYILSVNEPRKGMTSFPTKYPLNRKNMLKLWDEVSEYWASKDMVLKNSHFTE